MVRSDSMDEGGRGGGGGGRGEGGEREEAVSQWTWRPHWRWEEGRGVLFHQIGTNQRIYIRFDTKRCRFAFNHGNLCKEHNNDLNQTQSGLLYPKIIHPRYDIPCDSCESSDGEGSLRTISFSRSCSIDKIIMFQKCVGARLVGKQIQTFVNGVVDGRWTPRRLIPRTATVTDSRRRAMRCRRRSLAASSCNRAHCHMGAVAAVAVGPITQSRDRVASTFPSLVLSPR